MHVVGTGKRFLELYGEWLHRSEITNNLLLSVAALTDLRNSVFKPPFWFAAVLRGDYVAGCALYAMPDGLCLSALDESASAVLVDKFNETDIFCARIAGPEDACIAVSSLLKATTDVIYEPITHWQSFIVADLFPPTRPASGKLRLTKTEDNDIIVDYGTRYGLEKPSVVEVSKYFLYKSAADQLWAWDDDGIKTLIAVAGRTRNSIRVSGVFTPAEYRVRGYASTAVYEVSKRFLGDGCRFCHLVVDKADPHVMRIYENIGYTKFESRLEMRPKS